MSGLGASSMLVSTCFESEDELRRKYSSFAGRVRALRSAGATILFNVDAQMLHEHPDLIALDRNFHVCVFNFPHVGGGSREADRVANVAMLSLFFKSAMLAPFLRANRSHVHVVLRNTPFYQSWNIRSIAKDAGLTYRDAERFESQVFQELGYQAVRTSGEQTQVRQAPDTEDAVRYIFQRA